MELFPKLSFVVWGLGVLFLFLTVIHGHSWLSLPCLLPPQ